MILDRITASKKTELEECKRKKRSLAASLRKPGGVALIAEVKKVSPSRGLFRADFKADEIARAYAEAGAAAVSVLTEREFFQGSPEHLSQVRGAIDLPLLRKDFIIDPYQIYEAKILGADAVLLIMAVLTDREAKKFLGLAAELGLEGLVEVHNREEMRRALTLGAGLIGINNRDLKTFQTDLETTFRLREMVTDPAVTVVSESGITARAEMIRLQEHGVHAALVGEALIREPDIGAKVRELLGTAPAGPGQMRRPV